MIAALPVAVVVVAVAVLVARRAPKPVVVLLAWIVAGAVVLVAVGLALGATPRGERGTVTIEEVPSP